MLTSPGSSQRSVTAAGSEGLWDLTADKINSKVICAEAATEATGGDGGGKRGHGLGREGQAGHGPGAGRGTEMSCQDPAMPGSVDVPLHDSSHPRGLVTRGPGRSTMLGTVPRKHLFDFSQ